MFEMPIRHPDGDAEVEDGHTCLEFKGEVQPRTTDLGDHQCIDGIQSLEAGREQEPLLLCSLL